MKKPRYLDHSRIGRLIPPKPDDPDYALIPRQGGWSMTFYDHRGKSAMLPLQTDDLVLARARRDDLYRKAKAAGRGAMSKMEFYAQKIVGDPSISHGIKYLVHFNNQKGVFDSIEQAVKFRRQVAVELLEKARGNPGAMAKDLRPSRMRKGVRSFVTSADFKTPKRKREVAI